MQRRFGVGLAAVVTMLAGPALAQPGILEGGRCVPLPNLTDGCADGSRCRGDGGFDGSCVNALALSYCVPDEAVVCCLADSDCPTPPPGSITECLDVSGFGICRRPGTEYCSGSVFPTPMQVAMCHRDSGSTELLIWARGDCDGDGVRNGDEVDRGTDPCLAPVPRAVWSGPRNQCDELPQGCVEGEACSTPAGDPGECALDGGDTVCRPPGPALYCGDGEWECPRGQIEVEDVDRRQTFCTVPFCEASTTVACVHEPLTGEPVAPENGDCDFDGIANKDEEEGHVCLHDAPSDGGMNTDGGVVSNDAGDVGPDGSVDLDGAVVSNDGGGGSDAAANVPISFGGGGGCACRATPASKTPLGLLVLAGFGLGLSARGSGRARRTRRGL